MKKFKACAVLFMIILTGSNFVGAQIRMPDLSPSATVTQKVGFNEVRIEYSRPSARGRVIYGDVVPFGEVWRVGANASTKIYVWEELTINDQYKLPAGTYALYAIPNKDEWTIIINKDPYLWGAYGYKQSSDAFRFTVKPMLLKEQVETFTIQFANICTGCADVQLLWDFTKVSFKVSSNVDEKIMSDIKSFTGNPEAKLAGEYYMSAKYYLDTNRDMKQALEWIDKSLQYGPEAYWALHTKAEIQAKMGDYNAAIETAKSSMDQAKAKNDKDYVKMNEKEIAKWKEVKKNK